MATYTPVKVVDDNPKDWGYKIGLMDWDDTKIVFTKRGLVNYLKSLDVTVDTNSSQLSKLPRKSQSRNTFETRKLTGILFLQGYAEFGKVSGLETEPAPTEASAPAAQDSTRTSASPADSGWIPTRRVRTAPGGAQTFSFGDDEPAGATASRATVPEPAPQAQAEPAPAAAKPEYRVVDNDGNIFKPTRRVRDNPGGKDSIASLFSDN
ncbi:hypothetical protein RhiJN_13872 [Ceratobasidium sp. AG-Ba]|nr:hypothetical protein RhiJN_13872 [Ceratobasidium sp. AG-Ba]